MSSFGGTTTPIEVPTNSGLSDLIIASSGSITSDLTDVSGSMLTTTDLTTAIVHSQIGIYTPGDLDLYNSGSGQTYSDYYTNNTGRNRNCIIIADLARPSGLIDGDHIVVFYKTIDGNDYLLSEATWEKQSVSYHTNYRQFQSAEFLLKSGEGLSSYIVAPSGSTSATFGIEILGR